MKEINRLTEGAVLLAAFAVFLLITLYIPAVGVVMNLFLSLPFILYSAKYGWKPTAVFTLGALLLSLVIGSLLAIPLTLAFGLTGIVMGSTIRIGKSRLQIYIAGSLAFLATMLIQYVVAVAFFQFNFIEQVMDMLQESVDLSISMLENIGQPANKRVIAEFHNTLELFETIMPSMFVLIAFTTVFLIQLVSFPILNRLGIKVVKWKPLREWTLPKSILWYYLISMVASMFIQPAEGTYWYVALANLLYVLQILIILQGISFLFYVSYIKGYSMAIPVTGVILSLLIPFILYIVRILGIIDLGFDLRKRIVKK
ncbi:YybS family protein [Bacillus sp. T33-2]|uniref:YybS family protein n=1 Tax=Bacillus sp. T33-2 TaxID=2054168 RepID=UPI000C77DB33|nr:YybS family protein [Bacillus sp. T33-2]PLR94046.1 DUF2232 domain-containing protein [Bacillus sp. T33-2]